MLCVWDESVDQAHGVSTALQPHAVHLLAVLPAGASEGVPSGLWVLSSVAQEGLAGVLL